MTTDHTLAVTISAEQTARIRQLRADAGRWLEPFMDWCDRYVAVRAEFEDTVRDSGLGEIYGVYEAVGRGCGMDQVNLIECLIAVEADRLSKVDPEPLRADLASLVDV